MYLKRIEISNFRNIKKLNLDLNKRINIFIGKNAQGKTSILESIYVLAFTKSCRGYNENELINKDSFFFKINGLLKKGNSKKKLEVSYKKEIKVIKLDNVVIKRVSDYVSSMNVIMFSPDDLDIVKKSPNIRRNFINIELCQLYPEYLRVLNEYNKILKMRNEYIRKNYNSVNYQYLDVITSSLIDRAIDICNYRSDFVNKINKIIDDIFYKIYKKRGLKIFYKNNLDYSDKKEILLFYKANYNSEIEKGSTLYGPHRDDFEFYYKNDNLKLYGSQGLQKLSILSFKFAEIEIIKEIKGNYPIVLLDDIFSEIDLEKRKNLLKFIKRNIQFIITTTDIKNISEKVLSNSTIFEVVDGSIKKRSDKSERK